MNLEIQCSMCSSCRDTTVHVYGGKASASAKPYCCTVLRQSPSAAAVPTRARCEARVTSKGVRQNSDMRTDDQSVEEVDIALVVDVVDCVVEETLRGGTPGSGDLARDCSTAVVYLVTLAGTSRAGMSAVFPRYFSL